MMDRIWKLSILIVFLVIIDQITKGIVESNFVLGERSPVIGGFLDWTYIKNTGAAFGFGANAHIALRTIGFKVLPVLACFWLVYLIWTTRKEVFHLCLAYSMILGGAIGNLIDRISKDYVVDFVLFYIDLDSPISLGFTTFEAGLHAYPAFNVADSAITIAALILIWDFFLHLKKNKAQEGQENKKKEATN